MTNNPLEALAALEQAQGEIVRITAKMAWLTRAMEAMHDYPVYVSGWGYESHMRYIGQWCVKYPEFTNGKLPPFSSPWTAEQVYKAAMKEARDATSITM